MSFSGASGLQESVRDALGGDNRVEVISESDVAQAEARFSVSSHESRAFADFVDELHADLVFEGDTQGRGARRSLTLRVVDARGRDLGHERILMRAGSGRADGVALRLLGDALVARERTEQEPARTPVEADTREDEPVRESAHNDERERDDERDDERDHESRREHSRREEPTHYTYSAPIFVIAGGVTIRSRNVDIALSDGMRRRLSAWFPELHVFAELRPLATDSSVARGIFLRGEFAQEVGLTLRNDNTSTNFDPNFYRFLFQAGLLFPVEQVVEIGPDLGFGMDIYDLKTNTTLPSAQYMYARAALRSRIRLIGEEFVLDASAALRIAFSRGELSEGFGAGGSTVGIDIGGGFSGAFDNGLFYTLHVHWVNYWLTFSGDPSMAWNDLGYRIGGVNGVDGSVRFTFAAGYAFR